MDRDERIAYLKAIIEEKNNDLHKSLSKITELHEELADPQSDRNPGQIEDLKEALASAKEQKKFLTDVIAKYDAELKQLEGAEPISLPSPGIIYY